MFQEARKFCHGSGRTSRKVPAPQPSAAGDPRQAGAAAAIGGRVAVLDETAAAPAVAAILDGLSHELRLQGHCHCVVRLADQSLVFGGEEVRGWWASGRGLERGSRGRPLTSKGGSRRREGEDRGG